MKVTDIAFVKHVGIERDEDELSLAFKEDALNHINSIHACAVMTLAETQSGLCLQELFPEFVENVVPVLREAKIKYKKPALQKIMAFASIQENEKLRFKERLMNKGRASVEVHVEVRDIDDVCVAQATFSWYAQKL